MHCTSILLLTVGTYLPGQLVLNLRQHSAFYKFQIAVDCHNAVDMEDPITPCAQMPAQSVNPEILSCSINRCGISPLQWTQMCRFTLPFFLELLFNSLWHLLCEPRIIFVSNRKTRIEFHPSKHDYHFSKHKHTFITQFLLPQLNMSCHLLTSLLIFTFHKPLH